MKTTETTGPELLPDDGERWTVHTIHHPLTRAEKARTLPPAPRVKHHELRFGGELQLKDKGEGGLDRLQRMAKHLNRRKLRPIPEIQCAADAPNPEKYLHKIRR